MSQARLRRKRSKKEIIYHILKSVSAEPKTKTGIMYSVGSSYTVTMQHLNELVNLGLLKEENRMYSLTEKGAQVKDLLAKYFELEKQLEDLEAKINEILPVQQKKKSQTEQQEAQPQPVPPQS